MVFYLLFFFLFFLSLNVTPHKIRSARLTWRSTFYSTVWSTRLVYYPPDYFFFFVTFWEKKKRCSTSASKVVSLETIDQKKQTSRLPPYLPGQLFVADSSVAQQVDLAKWNLNACIRAAYCYQNGMWEYAMHLGFEKWPRNNNKKKKNQDLKGDIYIYISMLLFIKTLFSNKKNCFV